MQIDDEITEGKTGIRWGWIALFFVLAIFILGGIVRFYRSPAQVSLKETSVACELQPTIWKGEYLLPLPPIAVNVLSFDNIGPVLHISVALVVPRKADIQEVHNALPLIKESIVLLGRGLSAQDIQSPEALYRLKQALLKRIQWVLDSVVVQDVLITELFLDDVTEEN